MAANLRSGQSMTGLVKSYNRKGFGFIMCQAIEQDIYFSRESLHPNLQTSDLAGEQIQFEIHRFPDGKLQARNLRALGDVSDFRGSTTSNNREYGAGARASMFQQRAATGGHGGPQDEDRSRDWYCKSCGERNFLKRFECFKCKAQKPLEEQQAAAAAVPAAPAPKRHLSPHAGSRAMREMYKKGLLGANNSAAADRSRSRGEKSPSSSSSSSSRAKKKKKKSKKSKSKRSTSSSSSSSAKSEKSGKEDSKSEEGKGQENPDITKAKDEALRRLLMLKQIESKDQRLKEFRVLLREWHPDKNLERKEVATAVFQFLQKGKRLIDT